MQRNKHSSILFSKLERKSKNFLSKNQLKDFGSILSDETGYNSIIFFNTFHTKRVKRVKLLKFLNKYIFDGVFFIYSSIISNTDKNELDCFYIYQQNKDKLNSYSLTSKRYYFVEKIISGGQTGADQAGLFAGKELGLYVGGTAPKNYYTEKGANFELKSEFCLSESDYSNYNYRTMLNVLDSDATVIFGDDKSPGSMLTIKECKKWKKPFYLIPEPAIEVDNKIEFIIWLLNNDVKILNVAGNRESVNPGIARDAYEFLVNVFGTSAIGKRHLIEKKSVWLGDNYEAIRKYEENCKKFYENISSKRKEKIKEQFR